MTTVQLTFGTCFWDSYFTSTTGFEVLCERMRDGKQMCQDFEEFLRQRADAEEKYGNSLIRIATNAKGKEEIGTLKDSWEVLKTETENMGQLHVSLAHQLTEELERVRALRETQREKRKRVEESMKIAQRNKNSCFDNNARNKTTYEQKCREADAAEDALRRSVSLASKDEDKLRAKHGRAKTAVEQADTAYQNSVRVLEDARVVWEKEMEQCCDLFESLEKERIKALRDAFWNFSDMTSLNCVEIEEICKTMKGSLELCEVESDIQSFIDMKQTGSKRPARVEYEDFYATQSSQNVLSPSSGVNIRGPVAGSFLHSKDTSITLQHNSTLKPARPQKPIPDRPKQAPVDESMVKTSSEPAHLGQSKE